MGKFPQEWVKSPRHRQVLPGMGKIPQERAKIQKKQNN
jgi:hypothetical protein